MIILKDQNDLKLMRKGGDKAARLLDHVQENISAGISTDEINTMCEKWISANRLKSAILGYRGFPKSVCTSVNEIVCHGIPKKDVILKNGDIVNVDITLIYEGFHADTSRTFLIGEVSTESFKLVKSTHTAMMCGIKAIAPGKRLNVIGEAISKYVGPLGYSITTALGGHGIGKKFHEEPFVFHHLQKKKSVLLKEGMTFTVEPMLNLGKNDVYTDAKDGWSVINYDGKLSAQFEHTVAVTNNGAEILTLRSS